MSIWCAYTASLTLLVCPSFAFFNFIFKSMKANFKASSKQDHLIHYRSEYRPLQNPLWDISVPTMPTMKNSRGNIVTSLRNIEPKLVVKLQPFGTERVKGWGSCDGISLIMNAQ